MANTRFEPYWRPRDVALAPEPQPTGAPEYRHGDTCQLHQEQALHPRPRDTQQVVKACGEKPVKVIIETALLTDTEKIADLSTNDSWHNRLEWRR